MEGETIDQGSDFSSPVAMSPHGVSRMCYATPSKIRLQGGCLRPPFTSPKVAFMVSHWSHSQVESILNCGKSYELGRLRGAPKTPTVWSPAGVALHDVADLIHRGEVSTKKAITDAWHQGFDEMVEKQFNESGVAPHFWRKAGRVSKESPDREDVDWWRTEGARQLWGYKQWLKKSGYKVARLDDGTVLSEHETTTLFGSVEVRGFLDVVFVTPDDELIVCDLKSGSRVPDKFTQLGLYRVALQQNHPDEKRPIVGGCFFMTRKSQPTEVVDLRVYSQQYFTHIFSMADSIREAEAFLPNPGSFCRICDVREACFTMGGLESWKFDRLNPQHPDYVGFVSEWKQKIHEDFPQDTHTQ